MIKNIFMLFFLSHVVYSQQVSVVLNKEFSEVKSYIQNANSSRSLYSTEILQNLPFKFVSLTSEHSEHESLMMSLVYEASRQTSVDFLTHLSQKSPNFKRDALLNSTFVSDDSLVEKKANGLIKRIQQGGIHLENCVPELIENKFYDWTFHQESQKSLSYLSFLMKQGQRPFLSWTENGQEKFAYPMLILSKEGDAIGILGIKPTTRINSVIQSLGIWSVNQLDLDQHYPHYIYIPKNIDFKINWYHFEWNEKRWLASVAH